MSDKLKRIEREYPQPCTPDDSVTMNQPDRRISAVRRVIPIIAQHKILILPKNDFIVCISRILDHLCAVILHQDLAIDIDIAVLVDSYRFSRQPDNTLDIIGILLIFERKYDNIKPLRITEPLGDLIHDQTIPVMDHRLHTASRDSRPLCDIFDHKERHK